MAVVVCINTFMLALILFGLMREFRLMRLYSERLSSRVKQLEGEKERLGYERALARSRRQGGCEPARAEPDRGRLGDMQNKALLFGTKNARRRCRAIPAATPAQPPSSQSSGCGSRPCAKRRTGHDQVPRRHHGPLDALMKEPIATPTAMRFHLSPLRKARREPCYAPTSPSSMPGRPGFLV